MRIHCDTYIKLSITCAISVFNQNIIEIKIDDIMISKKKCYNGEKAANR